MIQDNSFFFRALLDTHVHTYIQKLTHDVV